MLAAATRKRIVDTVYKEGELWGCQVGYYGDMSCSSMADGFMMSTNISRVAVIVEETLGEAGVVIDAALLSSTPTVVPDLPPFISNKSRTNSEFVGAGLSCGFAVIAGMGVLGGAAAEVPTGGASTLLVVVAWTGFATSSIQCLNGIVRVFEAESNPETNSLQQWDDNAYYSNFCLFVDALGIAASLASLPSAAKNVFAVLRRRGALVTEQALSAMSTAERKAAMKLAAEQASATPEGRAELLKALRDGGLNEKQAAQALTLGAQSGRRAKVALRAISEVTATRLNMHLLSAVSAGFTPLVSATPSRVTGSASGSVNSLIVHIFNLQQG